MPWVLCRCAILLLTFNNINCSQFHMESSSKVFAIIAGLSAFVFMFVFVIIGMTGKPTSSPVARQAAVVKQVAKAVPVVKVNNRTKMVLSVPVAKLIRQTLTVK